MSAELIILSGIGETALSATDAARVERDKLIAAARAVGPVVDPTGADVAAVTLRRGAEFTRMVEAARVAVKAPVIELGRKIDALAKELVAGLDEEAERISRSLGTYQAEQRRLEEEAKRKAREEEERIWREAQAREAAEKERIRKQEAEAAEKARKLQAELAEKAERARSEKGREKALAEAEAARVQAEIEVDQRRLDEERAAQERNEEAGKRMVAARTVGLPQPARKPLGVATREEIVFEVTDIRALYAAEPHMVVLSPNATVIKHVLKSYAPGQQVSGLKWWKEAKTHARG